MTGTRIRPITRRSKTLIDRVHETRFTQPQAIEDALGRLAFVDSLLHEITAYVVIYGAKGIVIAFTDEDKATEHVHTIMGESSVPCWLPEKHVPGRLRAWMSVDRQHRIDLWTLPVQGGPPKEANR